MSDEQNLVQKQKIGATILDNCKTGAIAQELNISILQGINMRNISRLKCQKACAAGILLFRLYRGKMAISPCYMACGHGHIIPHTN